MRRSKVTTNYVKNIVKNKMGLLNYTTKIDADKTISEIQKILSKVGAMKIMTDYTDGVVSALSFALKVNEQIIGFKLPCDWRPVYKILTKDKDFERYWDKDKKAHLESEWRLQAVRTSWRIVKDWVEAQCALIETQMVKTEEVFLPYMVVKSGQTLFQEMSDTNFRLEKK
jgi:hypothetical protein